MTVQQMIRCFVIVAVVGLAPSGFASDGVEWASGEWDESGLVDQSCEYCPRWTVGASALILHRQAPRAGALAFDFFDPAASLNGDDFDFGFQGGFEVALIRHSNDGTWPDIEARFFAIDGWSDNTITAMNPANPIQINTSPPTFLLGGAAAIDASYSSELYNVELNLRSRLNDVLTGLVGFRYVELNEGLGMSFPGTPITYDVNTSNRLYGAQIGLEANRSFDLWELGVFAKAGLFGNAAGHDTVTFTGGFSPGASDDDSSLAFVGEIGITGRFPITERLSLVGGYRLLWIEGVALASDQIAATDLLAEEGISTGGGVFYHGATAGLEFTW